MSREVLINGLRFLFLLVAQVFIFDQIDLSPYVAITVTVLFVALLPLEYPLSVSLLLSFLLGLSVDALESTWGLQAASLTATAYLRPRIVSVLFPKRDRSVSFRPGMDDMGGFPFIIYLFLLTFVAQWLLFVLQDFTLSGLGFSLLQLLPSAPLSTLLMLLLFLIFGKTNLKQ